MKMEGGPTGEKKPRIETLLEEAAEEAVLNFPILNEFATGDKKEVYIKTLQEASKEYFKALVESARGQRQAYTEAAQQMRDAFESTRKEISKQYEDLPPEKRIEIEERIEGHAIKNQQRISIRLSESLNHVRQLLESELTRKGVSEPTVKAIVEEFTQEGIKAVQ